MDIDKLIRDVHFEPTARRVGSLMDIDKLILTPPSASDKPCFGSLMDIDKLIRYHSFKAVLGVLVL